VKATPTMSPEEVAAWLADPMMGFAGRREEPAPQKHGTGYAYRKGCRCPGCCFAWSTYQRNYREFRQRREAQ
jgi:hypothetical protein